MLREDRYMIDLQEGILELFAESAAWSAEDSFKAMSMHVQWHTDRVNRNAAKQAKYRASLLQDDAKRARRLEAKRLAAKAAYVPRSKS